MDFDDPINNPNFEELLNSTTFPPQFDQLELDSLLYGNDESQESSSSSTFAFSDRNSGFRSRDGGSLGDSSSDSSPPLSCANVAENEQELWDFGFQNQGSFDNFEQQFGGCYPKEEMHLQHSHSSMDTHYNEDEQLMEEQFHLRPREIITILPKQHPQPTSVKRVAARPIQKIYRMKEAPMSQGSQTYRVVRPACTPHRVVVRSPQQKRIYVPESVSEIQVPPQSGPLVRQASEEQRFVPIAPTSVVKKERLNYSPEQNRKIRNRMYAQASRIRKKEAEEIMKQNLQELLEENELLKLENNVLKQRLAYYEHEEPIIEATPQNFQYGKSQKQRKIIAAGTALMMFGLLAIISPFSLQSADYSQQMNIDVMKISNETALLARHGRVLGIEENPVAPMQQNVDKYPNATQNECEMYKLNATEALRVNNDIDRWVQVHSFDNVPIKFSGGLMNKEAMKKFNDARKPKLDKPFGPQKQEAQKKSEQAALRFRERTWRQLDLLKTGNNIQMDSEKIQRNRQDIDKIASIVRHKRDTLYIITLQDYVLLPSLKKGANSVPKLSLLLPSVPMNGTMLDQYTLLRVDCEVTGTGQLTLSNKQLSYLMP